MRFSLLTAGFCLASSMAFAAEPDSAMQSFLDTQIMPWVETPMLIDAITAQNANTAGYDAAQIDALDQQWRAEVGAGASDLVDGVLMNSAAEFLRQQVEKSDGTMTEIFLMDAHGLNVAASQPTSDYWQGDEDKFQKTYDVGAHAVHFSEIEFDESSQTYQAQISLTLTDPATGAPIGAMTVGINAESLM
ncbi:hypothetical protein [Sagittula salina]|uniref:Uncharacterized protein n=1 Tax=Sagittula salina TaxID=2820268 RepID=A0A940S0D2_9RHOB|nr:hypothetical protein [Sagittula salina]MBP0482943.1 hypothetical protein [Sagittula salina]